MQTHSQLPVLVILYVPSCTVQRRTENTVVQHSTVHPYTQLPQTVPIESRRVGNSSTLEMRRLACTSLSLSPSLSLSLSSRAQSFVRPFTLFCCVASGYFQMFPSNLSMCSTNLLYLYCKSFPLMRDLTLVRERTDARGTASQASADTGMRALVDLLVVV